MPKIQNYNALGSPAAGDLVAIVDVSTAADEVKKISVQNLFGNIPTEITVNGGAMVLEQQGRSDWPTGINQAVIFTTNNDSTFSSLNRGWLVFTPRTATGATGTPGFLWGTDDGSSSNTVERMRLDESSLDVKVNFSTTGAATLDTGANGSSFGGDLTVSGATTLSSTVTLADATQNYVISQISSGSELGVQSQSAGTPFSVRLFTNDGDGTDDVALSLHALGTPGALQDRERMLIRYDSANSRYSIDVEENGTGVLRPIHLGASGLSPSDLVLNTDGSVSVGVQLNATFPNTSTGTGLLVATNDGSTQEVFRDSSTLAHKRDVARITLEDARRFLGVDAISYEHRGGHRDVGFGAEHVHDAGLEDVVTYVDGEPMGFKSFGRGLIGYHHVLIQDHDTRLTTLETREERLERAFQHLCENPSGEGRAEALALLN